MSEKKTFFISRAGPDKRWAELIASVVRDAGHDPIHQDQDFAEGTSFSHNMMLAAESNCTIVVLSPEYFESKHCLAELHAALAADPLGVEGLILPVLVAPCEVPRLLGHLAHVDLRGSKDDAARGRFMSALLRHGKFDVTKLALAGRTRRVIEHANRNRTAMIEKVRTIWISGLLQQSLFHETRILLGLSDRPDAVVRPMDLLVKRPDEGERPLPTGTQIVEVFDSMDQALLILGAPGSGKTTLLLELARDLLNRATDAPEHPIPVVFPVSTWAEQRKPLLEWLQDELNLRYDVPRAIAKEWVLTDLVLPLLDGLDEVKAEHRAACVEAINAFRKSHGFLPLAITSRTADYEGLSDRLRLQGAILVRPLTPEQVNTYLAGLGPAAEPVRAAIGEDSSLRDLLDSPLLLNVLTVSYTGSTTTPVRIIGTAADRRDHLFGTYVKQMLQRRTADRRYSPEQTGLWLSWLAGQMTKHGQTVFYLEGLQRDWLPRLRRWAIPISNSLVAGLIVSFVFALVVFLVLVRAYSPTAFLRVWVDIGLPCGLVVGLVVGIWSLGSQDIVCVERVRWSWPRFWNAASERLAAGVMLLYCYILFNAVDDMIFYHITVFSDHNESFSEFAKNSLAAGLAGALVVGQVVGLVAGSVYGQVVGLAFRGIVTEPIQNAGMLNSDSRAFDAGLVVGLVSVLVFRWTFGLVAGLLAGLAFGSISRLLFGLTLRKMKTWPVHHEGIRKTLQNAFLVTLVIGLVCRLVSGRSFGILDGLAIGGVFGVIGGLVISLFEGQNLGEIKTASIAIQKLPLFSRTPLLVQWSSGCSSV